MNKSLVVSVLALVLAVVALFFPQVTERVVETTNLGSGAGSTNTFPQEFIGGIVVGGLFSTSTAGSMTLPVSAIDQESVVVVLPQAATTLTLPASTTLSAVIPSVGMSKTFILNNRSTTTNAITIAGSTGTKLKNASTSAVINASPTGSGMFEVTLTRLFTTDVSASVVPFGG